ncbi:hypothetical protein QOT17_017395 [Balamuthia mandrillaris]
MKAVMPGRTFLSPLLLLLLLSSLFAVGCALAQTQREDQAWSERWQSNVDFAHEGWGCAFRGGEAERVDLLAGDVRVWRGIQPDCEVFFLRERSGEEESAEEGWQRREEDDGGKEGEGDNGGEGEEEDGRFSSSFSSSSGSSSDASSSSSFSRASSTNVEPQMARRTVERFLISHKDIAELRRSKANETGKPKQKEVVWGPHPFHDSNTATRPPLHSNETVLVQGVLQASEKYVVQFEVPFEGKGVVTILFTVYLQGKDEESIGYAASADTIAIPPYTVKLNWMISDWSFEREATIEEEELYERFLQISMVLYVIDTEGHVQEFLSFDEQAAEQSEEQEQEVVPVTFGEDSFFSLISRFLKVAEVDNMLLPISLSTKSNNTSQTGYEVTMTFPQFNSSLFYDPDFQVLLPGRGNEGEGKAEEDDGEFCCSSGGFVALLCGLVLLAVVVVFIGLVTALARRRYHNKTFRQRNPTCGVVQVDLLTLDRATTELELEASSPSRSRASSSSSDSDHSAKDLL